MVLEWRQGSRQSAGQIGRTCMFLAGTSVRVLYGFGTSGIRAGEARTGRRYKGVVWFRAGTDAADGVFQMTGRAISARPGAAE